MGNIFLELAIANIQNMECQKEVSFFVDTGATRSWIPQEIADELGIAPPIYRYDFAFPGHASQIGL